MDLSLITALLGAQASNTRLDMGAELLRMNADSERAIVQMIGAVAQNANPLANVAAGTGTNLDITA
ncbi:MAG TPA: hypothetical protein VH249_13530 [Xanthobacteraceae bacterium]|jgi:hypothetical protein|nr:hypothetical protein [Xanthobacteraceae bacterium]